MKAKRSLLMGLAAAALLAFLVGCQAVFTFSPMGFLQRDPSRLPLAQKMTYAENALASGDDQTMLDAYNAIKNDAAGSADGDLNLLAAKLYKQQVLRCCRWRRRWGWRRRWRLDIVVLVRDRYRSDCDGIITGISTLYRK